MSAHPPEGHRGIGTHTVAINEVNGQVVLRFERPVEWVALDPEGARGAAEHMARMAYKAQFGDVPTTKSRSAITDAKAARLRIRVAKMLTSMQGDDVKVQANAIIDAVFTEIA